MKSICFFASYFQGDNIPYYISVYLLELKRHFSEIVFTYTDQELSKSSIQFLDSNHIIYKKERNEGFDFGQWYNAIKLYNLEDFDKVAFVNDSCVLYASLNPFMEWLNSVNVDFGGFTQSNYENKNHIQSYFLVLNKKAIPFIKPYFEKNGILPRIELVIETYEIGFSQHLILNHCRYASFVHNDGYQGPFSPYYQCIQSHINQGIPLIKSKILFQSYRKKEQRTLARMHFIISTNYYIDLIKLKFEKKLILDFGKLLAGHQQQMSFLDKFMYQLWSGYYFFGQKLKALIKK